MEMKRIYVPRTPSRVLEKVDDGYIEDYKLVKKLGKGSYGKIYLGIKDGKEYTIKLFRSNKGKTYFDREIYILELLAGIESTSFSKLVEILDSSDSYRALVFEYIYGIDAFDIFYELRKMGQKDKLETVSYTLLRDIGIALKQLHSHGIVHMDVKSENIMYSIPEQKFKLIDFGLSVSLKEEYSPLFESGMRGTKGYVANYMFDHNIDWTDVDTQKLLLGNDLFSLGATVFIINEDKYPYVLNNVLYDTSVDIGFEKITSELLRTVICKLTKDMNFDIVSYLDTRKEVIR